MIAPLIDRARAELSDAVRVRGDAGFISPEFLDLLDGKQVPYALRIPKNSELEKHEEIHARRPPGRPPAYLRAWCHDIEYHALRWPEARRVVLVVEEVPGDLFLKTYFIVTSFTEDELCARDVLDFYRVRGTMEGHIGEMKSVLAGRLSSTNRRKRRYARREIKKHVKPVDPERVNAAVLCVQALGYNLLNTFRSLAETSAFIDEPRSFTCEEHVHCSSSLGASFAPRGERRSSSATSRWLRGSPLSRGCVSSGRHVPLPDLPQPDPDKPRHSSPPAVGAGAGLSLSRRRPIRSTTSCLATCNSCWCIWRD